ncbi:hypothetical protein AB4Y30_03300 [Ornithinibacillus sp. 4-3]|uniref:Transporter n=1 Tax=Ornithinibacillus sp. 4-3 TaxID=3231488 RepID=A0AB39HSQ4_9BACI
MWKVLKIASAFIGIIVGAGFASGQEILQYFTSFGYIGTVGAIVSTTLFAYLGMNLVMLGSRLQTTSHKEVIYKISGRYLGYIVDAIIIFTLFGVGVVMVAGAGATLNQEFGLTPFLGSLLLTILILLTVMLNVEKVIAIIGGITPALIAAVVLISIYCIFTFDKPLDELNEIAVQQKSALSHWFISAINYVSFNIAVGAAMALVMGGAEKNERIAKFGGLFGGLSLGILIVLSHLAIFSKIDQTIGYDMPMLKIVNDISPNLSLVMAVVLFGMIFNTGVGMFYAFVARFVKMNTKKANIMIVVTLAAGFALSFVGFTDLVSLFYPIIGFLGLFLVFALIIAPYRIPKRKE